MPADTITHFADLALKPPLLKALNALGYEVPTAIQAQTIPLLLEGRDVLGQAQTGTGKTAAFALPLLSNLDLKQPAPQVLVLAPTRELAIQVAEAFKSYASQLKGFHVLPVYGGQEYGAQIRALQRGVHVLVGTPGRVMDHMRRGNIKLDQLKTLVLDEADEMLRMGFIDDVQWILEQTPKQHQIVLFSATLPAAVRKISKRYLQNPAEVTIEVKTTTAETIRQRYWPVSGTHKLDALTRILEAESFDAMLVFVRTKTATLELAEKLEARGYSAVALNGDIAQKNRERVIEQLKAGKHDILVATDVAARGLDVARISHVINYDIPHDTEAYVHRIGRTGRAGRDGDAILFVAPRERRMLQAIEKATRKEIELMELPSTDMVNNRRVELFKQRISDTLTDEDLSLFKELIAQYQQENQVDTLDIAAALAKQVQGRAPFLLSGKAAVMPARELERDKSQGQRKPRQDRQAGVADGDRKTPRDRSAAREHEIEAGMDRFRIEVGHRHKVMPGNIVGAIANEADIDSKYIGRINIFDDFSLVDLPEGMPRELLRKLKDVRVAGQRLNISQLGGKKKNAKNKPDASKPPRVRPKNRLKDKKNKGRPKRAQAN
ncbi:MAG: DEAD/DEAH box helicase [Gammaproteobacteria bacterium]|nr:DEAD/DEAH box helicase [Gammaproteobacteria bacterium]